MTVDLQGKASARPARGAVPQSVLAQVRAASPFRQTSPKRPPRGGAGRAPDGGAVRVFRLGVAPVGEYGK